MRGAAVLLDLVGVLLKEPHGLLAPTSQASR